MLADDRHANAEAEASATTGTLGGKKGIKKFRQHFRRDPDAIILNSGSDAIPRASETNLDAAGGPRFADGLLGIADEIEEDLNELIGVADDRGQTGDRLEFHFDIVATEGMILELQSAVDDDVEVQSLFLG